MTYGLQSPTGGARGPACKSSRDRSPALVANTDARDPACRSYAPREPGSRRKGGRTRTWPCRPAFMFDTLSLANLEAILRPSPDARSNSGQGRAFVAGVVAHLPQSDHADNSRRSPLMARL